MPESKLQQPEVITAIERGLCIFDIAWIGMCGTNGYWDHGGSGKHIDPPVYARPGQLTCIYHGRKKCSNGGCDNEAIGDCDATYSLVCGAPYCAECGKHLQCYPHEQSDPTRSVPPQ